MNELESVARALVAKGKGILAADESFPTIQKRFDGINAKATETTRNGYREILFTTKGLEAFISGVILFDETLRSVSTEGIPFPKLLGDKGILPGIKVDKGLAALAGSGDEKITRGLDGLRERLIEYRELGAKFVKWRAVITIGKGGIPTSACVDANAHDLARYAAISQEAGLVPIVEPEVLMSGDHDIQQCEDVSALTLRRVFSQLNDNNVMLEGMLLKPSMVLAGAACKKLASVQDVAEATVRCFKRFVPAAMPGVVFLSGGQTPVQATEHLNAINALGDAPWELSFSYGRALQEPPLKAWKGNDANTQLAQDALYHRAECNSAARFGRYSAEMETKSS